MSTGTTGREPLLMGMFTGLERAGRDPEPTPTSTASSSSNDNGTLKKISNVNLILCFEGSFNMKLLYTSTHVIGKLCNTILLAMSLNMLNQIHILTTHLDKIHLNIIIPLPSSSSKFLPSKRFPYQNPTYCDIFAQTKNCSARETAVASEWL
jgi:hypothetical protein